MFRLLLLAFLLIITHSAFSGGNWMTTDEGCNVWNPAPESGETASWNGECSNGVAQGHGIVKWFKYGNAGNEVEGDYVDGLRKGKAIVRYPNGDVYDGFLSEHNGSRNGPGVLTKANGSIMSGIWSNGNLSSTESTSNGPSALERFGNWGKAYQEYERQNRGTNCTSTMQNGTVFTHCN